MKPGLDWKHKDRILSLLVYPTSCWRLPIKELWFFEPQTDFTVCCFDWVRSMDYISSDMDTEISSNGSRQRISRIGFSKHLTSCFNHVKTLPHLLSGKQHHRHIISTNYHERQNVTWNENMYNKEFTLTIATTGPEYMYCTKPLKNGLSAKSL